MYETHSSKNFSIERSSIAQASYFDKCQLCERTVDLCRITRFVLAIFPAQNILSYRHTVRYNARTQAAGYRDDSQSVNIREYLLLTASQIKQTFSWKSTEIVLLLMFGVCKKSRRTQLVKQQVVFYLEKSDRHFRKLASSQDPYSRRFVWQACVLSVGYCILKTKIGIIVDTKQYIETDSRL